MPTDITPANRAITSLRNPETDAHCDAIATVLDSLAAENDALTKDLKARSESLAFEQQQLAAARALIETAKAERAAIREGMKLALAE